MDEVIRVGKLLQRPRCTGVLDHALDPLDALLEGALAEARRRIAEREPEPVEDLRRTLEFVGPPEPALVPAECLGVVPFVLPEPSFLEAKARESVRVGAEPGTRACR